MTARFCPREGDALALVDIGQWPRQAPPDLLVHVSRCRACSEAILVASAVIGIDCQEAVGSPLPDARLVWQRAQWLARRDAIQRASRPLVAAQAIATLGLAVGLAFLAGWLTAAGMANGWGAMMADLFAPAMGLIARDTETARSPLGWDLPAMLWIGAAIVGSGLTVIALALGFSALADLPREYPHRQAGS